MKTNLSLLGKNVAHFACALLICGAFVAPAPVQAQSCLTFVPPLLFDTSNNPDASSRNQRTHGVDFLWFGGHRYLVYNTGNEVVFRPFDDAANPGGSSSSRFLSLNGGPVPPMGDRDYNLYNFSVCNDCDYGVAGYETQGSVIFELVERTGPALAFGAFSYDANAAVVGAFTFKHAGQQYLVMNRLPDDCGSATLYTINGVNQSNRTQLQCLETPGGESMNVDGGFYIPDGGDGSSYVYLVESQHNDVYMYRISGTGATLRLSNLGAVISATVERGWGMRLDLDGPILWPRLAVSGGFWGIEIWDIEQPANPFVLATMNPSFIRPENRTAISYPYMFAASLAGSGPGSTFMYDITTPTSPNLIEEDFWLADVDHPWNTYPYSNNQDGVLTADASMLVFSRYSVLQEIAIDCVDVAPVASMSITPQPAFPGDDVTVTNTTAGAYTESAIWVEDQTGAVVVGTGQMSATEPGSRQLDISPTVAEGVSYTAWVAVSSPDHLCTDPLNNPSLCGDQVRSAAIVLDRAPDAVVQVTPAAVITGDSVNLDASETEGHPTGYSWQVFLDGGTPPGHPPAGFDPADPTTTYPLSQSGLWRFQVTAFYAHTNGGEYQSSAFDQRDVTSVAADLTISPSSPRNTEEIRLCSTGRATPFATLDYSWEVTSGVTLTWQSTACGAVSGCADCGVIIPADSLDPGAYDVTLEIENTGNGDTSSAEESMNVADGSVTLDFTWSPNPPDIGETTVFSLVGVPPLGAGDQAVWSFGGPGCTGYSTNATCVPDQFTNCLTQGYKYSSAGNKNVSVTVTLGGTSHGPVSHSVTVSSSGSCGGSPSCTYTISPSAANYNSSGGSGTVNVDASSSSCAWNASTSQSWITITSGSSGTGDGPVHYTVAANSGGTRTGLVRVEGHTHSVTQDGGGSGQVEFTVSNSTPDIGESVRFEVSSQYTPVRWSMGGASCGGPDTIIDCLGFPEICRTVTWDYATAGGKTVTLTAEEGTATRTLTVQNQGQCEGDCDKDGAPTADFTMAPNPALLGETVTFTDASSKMFPATFSWSPQNPDRGELVTFEILGVGSVDEATWNFGAAGCTGYPQNETCTPYFTDCLTQAYKYQDSGTFTVTLRVDGGSLTQKTITVNDAGSCDGGGGCSYSISPPSRTIGSEGDTGTVSVSTQEGCTWSAQSNNSWLHVTSSPTEVGPGEVEYRADPNSNTSSRNGTLTIASKTFRLTQEGTGGGGGGGGTSPTEWSWLVRLDGDTVVTSNQPSFSHVFDQVGEYRVTLQAGNCAGSAETEQTLVVYEELIPEEQVVPAVVHAQGQLGTMWKSDLRLFNPGTETVSTTLEYHPQAASGVTHEILFDLAPNGTQVINDVVTYYNLPGPNNQGSLRITYEGGDGTTPVVMSRTYNDTPEGTFGQYVPAVPVLPPDTDALHLTGLVHNAEYRTNMGLNNMGSEAVADITVTLLDELGVPLGTYIAGIPANTTIPLVNVTELVGITGDVHLFSARVDLGESNLTAYASVIDNATGDPVLYVPALVEHPTLWVPGIAHLPGANDSQWRSDVSVLNRGTETVEARIEYVPDEDMPFIYAIRIELDPGEAYMMSDFLAELINPDVSSKGYITVTSRDGMMAPQVAARTYNQASTGTFGQNLKAFGAEDLVVEGETRYIPGVANGPDILARTNLGLLNTSTTTAASVEIILYDSVGQIIGQIPGYALEPEQFVQFDIFQAFGLEDQNLHGTVEVRAVSGGSVAAYCSIIDNGTQDPILVPTLQAY